MSEQADSPLTYEPSMYEFLTVEDLARLHAEAEFYGDFDRRHEIAEAVAGLQARKLAEAGLPADVAPEDTPSEVAQLTDAFGVAWAARTAELAVGGPASMRNTAANPLATPDLGQATDGPLAAFFRREARLAAIDRTTPDGKYLRWVEAKLAAAIDARNEAGEGSDAAKALDATIAALNTKIDRTLDALEQHCVIVAAPSAGEVQPSSPRRGKVAAAVGRLLGRAKGWIGFRQTAALSKFELPRRESYRLTHKRAVVAAATLAVAVSTLYEAERYGSLNPTTQMAAMDTEAASAVVEGPEPTPPLVAVSPLITPPPLVEAKPTPEPLEQKAPRPQYVTLGSYDRATGKGTVWYIAKQQLQLEGNASPSSFEITTKTNQLLKLNKITHPTKLPDNFRLRVQPAAK